MIKVVNNRNDGSLFHYAHFICDCLFPEIVNDIFDFKEVVRERNINQTIGNFSKIYTEVMKTQNIELHTDEFTRLNVKTIVYNNKEKYCTKKHFDKFRNFIFSNYKIDNSVFNLNYPEVILIKRYGRINLIDDIELKKINKNISTGKERREINQIDRLEEYLFEKYNNKFQGIFLELLPFKEQVSFFNNAKLIICAHGAGMSNLFFCKEGTKVIEVTCDAKWEFFDTISKILNLNHIKCHKNIFNDIISFI
jgi:hypothetical protein